MVRIQACLLPPSSERIAVEATFVLDSWLDGVARDFPKKALRSAAAFDHNFQKQVFELLLAGVNESIRR
jgi:hypothetical protein